MPLYYIVFPLFFIIFILSVYAVNTRLKCIRLKILHTPNQKKLERLNSLLLPYGFQYDQASDYFYSTVHCWQRKYGYYKQYDNSAATLGMIFDCEPIYFDYDGRHWLIEFWKGQYGLSAGAEVGVYAVNDNVHDNKAKSYKPQERHYKSIGDSELFPIRISLFYKEQLIAIRDSRHWWLTAFFLGRFYPPRTLKAKISVTFPDYDMCNAYIDGLRHAGYASTDISRCLLTVTVVFNRPKTAQPAAQLSLTAKLLLCANRLCCFFYRQLTTSYTDTLDKLAYLASLSPLLFKLALRFTRTQKRYNQYHLAKEYAYVNRKPFE